MIRVAVASRSFSRHAVLRSELLARFPHATFNDLGAALTGDALIAFLRGHERAIAALERIDDSILEALPNLRVISKYGVGLDTLDLDAMTRRGVSLGWTPGVNRRSVAELTIALIIAVLHRVPEATAMVRAQLWQQIAGRQLNEAAVGIVGCGNVGQEVVKLLSVFGCRFLAHDIRDYPAFFAEHHVKSLPLDDLAAEADIVSVHLPLNSSTRGLLDRRVLSKLKTDAILVNTSRGGIVDEDAVLSALNEGRLGGAAFDVLSSEPPTDRRLIDHPKVLVTPHIGGSTNEAVLAMGRAAIEGLNRFGLPFVIAEGHSG